MRFLFPLAVFALCSAVDVDLYAFGLSRHSYHEEMGNGEKPHERNPGLGAGVMLPVARDITLGALAATYRDSAGERARLAMPLARWTWRNRVCVDGGAGYFDGSQFHGFGAVATLGLRTIGPAWLHASGFRDSDGVWCAFAFVRVSL